MRITALRHTDMAEELAALWAVLSSTVKFTLEHSLNVASWVEVVDELVSKF
jgi:hypothetical protein